MVGWGVIFPDVTFDLQDPEWSLEVVCDAECKSDFIRYIQRLSRHTREREFVGGRQYPEALTRRDCEKVVQCFRRDFDLVPRMGELVRESHLELAELSERQYRVLDYALDPSNPRVFCPGAAGSGKTMISHPPANGPRAPETGARGDASGLNETNSSQHQTSYHIEMSGISVNNGRLERDRSVGIYPLVTRLATVKRRKSGRVERGRESQPAAVSPNGRRHANAAPPRQARSHGCDSSRGHPHDSSCGHPHPNPPPSRGRAKISVRRRSPRPPSWPGSDPAIPARGPRFVCMESAVRPADDGGYQGEGGCRRGRVC